MEVMRRRILPFVLSGGADTRQWPLSREAYPKQFHRLTGFETLCQQTCRRLASRPFGDLFVLTNHRHRFLIAEQLEEIGTPVKAIILEPEIRNTAPAACIAALMAVTPSITHATISPGAGISCSTVGTVTKSNASCSNRLASSLSRAIGTA